MALVTVSGTLRNHDRLVVPQGVHPQLVFRPNGATTSGGMRTNWEVPAKSYDFASGEFSVELESAPGIRYTPVLRWLVSVDQAPFEKQAYGYCEWPEFPADMGGNINELWDLVEGIGLVLVATSVPSGRPVGRYQLQYNPNTYDLYERKITWPIP